MSFTAAAPAEIRPIEQESVRRIVAGQAVMDLSSAVKELVDNALDANSKSINIRLFNEGLELVEVSDDGCGVPPGQSRVLMASPHTTSKIRSFEEIYRHDSDGNSGKPTMGFRGEALFCLANLSAGLVVATRTAAEPVAQRFAFGRDGSLDPASVSFVHRKVGTTVLVQRLLEAVPVRRSDLVRRIQAQRAALIRMMQGYAIFSVGVRIHLMDMVVNKRTGQLSEQRTMLATANHNASISENVSSVLGSKFLAATCPISIDLTSAVEQPDRPTGAAACSAAVPADATANGRDRGEEGCAAAAVSSSSSSSSSKWSVEGLVSKMVTSTSSGGAGAADHQQRQYFSINGRPVDLKQVAKVLNEVWRGFGGRGARPAAVLQFTLPASAYDINLAPDKRMVMLTHEAAVLQAVRDAVTRQWAHQTEGTFSIAPPATAPGRAAAAEHNAYSSPIYDYEDDEDDDEDKDGAKMQRKHSAEDSPSKFQRRYAFAHDLSKARLQHEYDDGRQRKRSRINSPSSEQCEPLSSQSSASAPYRSQQQQQVIEGTEGGTDPPSESHKEGSSNNAILEATTGTVGTGTGTGGATPVENEQEEKKQDAPLAISEGQVSATRNVCHSSNESQQEPSSSSGAVNAAASFRGGNDKSSTPSLEQDTNSTPSHENGGSSDAFDASAGVSASLSSSSATASSGRYSPSTRATGSELRKWRTVQNSFGSPGSSAGIKEEIQSLCNTNFSEPESRPVLTKGHGKTTSKFGLERFGFGAVRSSSSISPCPSVARQTNSQPLVVSDSKYDGGSSKIVPSTVKRPRKNNDLSSSTTLGRDSIDSSSNIHRFVQEEPLTPAADQKSQGQQSRARSGKEGNEAVVAFAAGTVDSLQQDDSRQEENREKITRQQPSKPPPDIVWDSFQGGTEQVLLSFRRERQMATCSTKSNRKRSFRNMTTSSSSSTTEMVPGDDSDEGQDQRGSTKDVTATVSTNISLTKDDFLGMTVIGQFNLGFILARSRDNHLWILDQHACDEKYNFERLCRETVIHEQRLLHPMPLELSPAQETCVLDHLSVFEKNGFRFRHDPDKPVRHRLSLTALPHSGARNGRKAVQFGKEDVTALCSMLSGGDDDDDDNGDADLAGGGTGVDGSGMFGNNAVRRYAGVGATKTTTSGHGAGDTAEKIVARLPKAIAMFASRACRSSIMIGTALSETEMDRVVQRLAAVQNPWNCPHGRPTMRHVADVGPLLDQDEHEAAERIALSAAVHQQQEEEGEGKSKDGVDQDGG